MNPNVDSFWDTPSTITDQHVEYAAQLAMKAHDGQFRRDGYTPYWHHITSVVDLVKKRKGDLTAIVVAYLHDTIEDCDPEERHTYNAQNYKKWFNKDVADAVEALTKQSNESYREAIYRAKANKIARLVKICDNLSNLADDPTDRQISKYAMSLGILMKEGDSYREKH